MQDKMNFLGNVELLKSHKIAFLCSRQIPAAAVLKCYDWAIEMRNRGECVISGFHSPLEKDIMNILVKGNQPIIIVLAKRFPKRVSPILNKVLDENRLLIISPFDEAVIRVSEQTALRRNEVIIRIANEIVVGFASRGGKIQLLISGSQKKVSFLTNTIN
jgi:predicted Rossmann fold nucleotide-binding protein DprA/Smf involved in DNA uptake